MKRKFDKIDCQVSKGPLRDRAGNTRLCQECLRDLPKFRESLDTPSKAGDWKILATRTLFKQDEDRWCKLCDLFLGNELKDAIESGSLSQVKINISQVPLAYAVGEDLTNGIEGGRRCLISDLPYLAQPDVRRTYDDRQAVITRVVTRTKFYTEDQLIGNSRESSRDYAVRTVNREHYDCDLVRHWMQLCEGQHRGKCVSNRPDVKRHQATVRHNIWLINCDTRTLESSSTHERYVTLSYVWGSEGRTAAEPWVHAARAELPTNIPSTIEDAITVTKDLSYKYLWVDYYCINQCDGVHKAAQIAIMDSIYNSSELTIIAAAGKDAQHGLPGVGYTKRQAQRVYQVENDLTLAHYDGDVYGELYNSPWNSRGWTFQEGILARRRLVFTNKQVYFECQCVSLWEALYRPLSRISSMRTGKIKPGAAAGFFQDQCQRRPNSRHQGKLSPHARFAKALEAYGLRKLSYEEDTLRALHGYLDMLFPGSNAYGLPLTLRYEKAWNSSRGGHVNLDCRLARALYWRHKAVRMSDRRSAFVDPPKRRNGFPSFTWMGWAGQATYELTGGFTPSFRAASFPEMSWDQLLTNPPAIIKVSAFTARIQIENYIAYHSDGTYWRDWYKTGQAISASITEFSHVYAKEDWTPVPKNNSSVRKYDFRASSIELDILYLGWSVAKKTVYCLIFERKEEFIERRGSLARQCNYIDEEEAFTRFESFLESEWKRETLILR